MKCPAKDKNQNMQFYFNGLGWADNNTYIQIHEIIYDPPPPDIPSTTSTKKMSAAKRKVRDDENEDIIYPNYDKLIKADPELQAKVDELIKIHTKKNND
jgi:hypothetical protein